MPKRCWLTGRVIKGDGNGRKIGFPTANIFLFSKCLIKAGVYSVEVKLATKIYPGLLYFGPKTINNSSKNTLEIYILDFKKNIYGKTIKFKLKKYLRPVIKFQSLAALKLQLEKDIKSCHFA